MSDAAEKYLPRIEGLLVLLLQKLGATSSEIGEVMGVSSSTVRKQYPGGEVSPAEIEVERRDNGG